MPGERPRGFWITKVELEMLLDELPGDLEVGILGMRGTTTSKVMRLLARQDPQIEKFAVVVQDLGEYVIHLGAPDARLGTDHAWSWLSVRENSPLHPHLRRQHSRRTKKTKSRRYTAKSNPRWTLAHR